MTTCESIDLRLRHLTARVQKLEDMRYGTVADVLKEKDDEIASLVAALETLREHSAVGWARVEAATKALKP